jgi:hypothetical protein
MGEVMGSEVMGSKLNYTVCGSGDLERHLRDSREIWSLTRNCQEGMVNELDSHFKA